MTVLSVNLNKIALIRNSRGIGKPSVADFAKLSLDNGAEGVTIHPRPDQRHATYQDAHTLSELIEKHYPHCELNIEGYPTEEWLDTVISTRPKQATLVPDDPNQLTSDHGWDCIKHQDFLKKIVGSLKSAGIRVSLFLDPNPEQVSAAKQTGCDRIELYTEPYARAFESGNYIEMLKHYSMTADRAAEMNLGVNAGHDLDQQNLATFCSAVNVLEVSIGHALVSEALYDGFASTVINYVALLKKKDNA